MKNILPYFLLLGVALQIWSCDEDSFSQVTTIELPAHEPRPAVLLHVDGGQVDLRALVSNSKGILDPDSVYKVPADATVDIYRMGSLYQSLAVDSLAEFYRASVSTVDGFSAEPGVDYELRLNIPGFDPISVKQVMPRPAQVISATFEEDGTVTPDGFRVDEFIVDIADVEPGVSNYYGLTVSQKVTYVNPSDPTDSVTYVFEQYLDTNDPTLTYGDRYNFVFTDDAFDGDSFTARMYSFGGSTADFSTYIVQLHSLTEDAYLYERSLDAYYLAQDNPFAEPVTVHSNIPNGFGVFSLGNAVEVEFD